MAGSAVPALVVTDLVAAARAYLRLGEGGEAALLAGAAAAAVATAEQFCGRVLVQRSFDAVLLAAPGWQRLPVRPVTAIAGVPQDALAVDIDADGIGWVRVSAAAGVAVTYVAGLAAGFDALPAPIAHGLVMLTAHLFEARDGAMPPAAVAALWRPYRTVRLMERAR